GFEVVARVDVLLLQPRFVLADDVQVEIFYAHPVQILGDLLGAGQRGSEKVDAFHEHPPERWKKRTYKALPHLRLRHGSGYRALEARTGRVSHTIFGFGSKPGGPDPSRYSASRPEWTGTRRALSRCGRA